MSISAILGRDGRYGRRGQNCNYCEVESIDLLKDVVPISERLLGFISSVTCLPRILKSHSHVRAVEKSFRRSKMLLWRPNRRTWRRMPNRMQVPIGTGPHSCLSNQQSTLFAVCTYCWVWRSSSSKPLYYQCYLLMTWPSFSMVCLLRSECAFRNNKRWQKMRTNTSQGESNSRELNALCCCNFGMLLWNSWYSIQGME